MTANCGKIERERSASERRGYRELGEIVKEVLTFMAKEKIIPSPQNYERWFRIFCYAKENNLNLSKSELVDIYLDLYQIKDDIDAESVEASVEKIAEDLFNEIQQRF
ncbi:MAG: hypothetical protein Q9N34_03750 [Aquificota bacterium]|nr:hypothetical protein [Aquificota bacterium]